MQRIRSFIAIPFPADIEKSIAKFIGKLSDDQDGIKWLPTETLHLTLKFLGDVENVEVPQICDVIRDVVSEIEPFDLQFASAQCFPDEERPRQIEIGVNDPTGLLSKLVGSLDVELAELGFKRDARDYRPHLSIGRIKGSRKRAGEAVGKRLQELIEQRAGQMRFGEMMADHVQLIGSFLDKKGPTYNVMDSIDF